MCDQVFASVTAAATALELSESTVRRMIAAGELPERRIRGRLRVPWAAIYALAKPAEEETA